MSKKVNRYRDKPLLVMVTTAEKEKIISNMHRAGLQTLSNYMRYMALNGRVIKIDFSTLKESLAETTSYVYELNKIGNNLNQIAHKLNQTDIVEKQDIEFLVSEFSKMQENYNRSQEILLREIRKITKKE